MKTVTPAVIKYSHYHSDAEGLVILADANSSPRHDPGADLPCQDGCRVCDLRTTVQDVLPTLRSHEGLPLLKVAVGLPVPALEAWLRCSRDPDVSEASWFNGLEEDRKPYTKLELKRRAYGSNRAPQEHQVEVATEEGERLAGSVEVLEERFPVGFGALANGVRAW